ncbi:MAG: hypothetical protein M1838_001120 [Thelocarpon superellum]|nr:MAG: hypothetical protein M1838_001120 [Thelocarpon superellum]
MDLRDAYRSSRADRAARSRVPIEQMISPKSTSAASPGSSVKLTQPPHEPPRPTTRLSPSLGRSILIDPKRGTDLGRGLIYLSSLLSQNNVKGDHFRQRFHERPGLKRKRLKSERWRKRFKVGFKLMLNKVRQMKKKGW